MIKGSSVPFPWKLHQLLEDADNCSSSDVVSWLPSGNGFIVHKPTEFCDKIVQKYFKQSKFKSFTRQLYIYGFSKIASGPHAGGFYHPKFVRGDKESCLSLKRNQVGDRRIKKANMPHPSAQTIKRTPVMPSSLTQRFVPSTIPSSSSSSQKNASAYNRPRSSALSIVERSLTVALEETAWNEPTPVTSNMMECQQELFSKSFFSTDQIDYQDFFLFDDLEPLPVRTV